MVRATNRDAVIEEIYAIAKGPKSFPATPESDNNGRKTQLPKSCFKGVNSFEKVCLFVEKSNY